MRVTLAHESATLRRTNNPVPSVERPHPQNPARWYRFDPPETPPPRCSARRAGTVWEMTRFGPCSLRRTATPASHRGGHSCMSLPPPPERASHAASIYRSGPDIRRYLDKRSQIRLVSSTLGGARGRERREGNGVRAEADHAHLEAAAASRCARPRVAAAKAAGDFGGEGRAPGARGRRTSRRRRRRRRRAPSRMRTTCAVAGACSGPAPRAGGTRSEPDAPSGSRRAGLPSRDDRRQGLSWRGASRRSTTTTHAKGVIDR